MRGLRSGTHILRRAHGEVPTEQMSAVLGAAAPTSDEFEWTDERRSELHQFIGDVLPLTGHYVLATVKQRPAVHDSFTSQVDLANAFLDRSETPDLYYATATFRTPVGPYKGRTQANVDGLRALRVDMDAGADKPFTDQDAALGAVVAALHVGLPKPTYVVTSGGGGLHLYWCLKADILPDLWLTVAKALHSAAVRLGLGPDPAVTTDTARVLRLPGSINGKTGQRAKVLNRTGARYDHDALARALHAPTANDEAHTMSAKATSLRPLNATVVEDYVNRAPASFPKIVASCSVMSEATHAAGAGVPEPLWRGALGIIKHCADPEHHAAQASQGHADFDIVEMRAKMDAWTAGPTTCVELGKHLPKACDACEHRGKIKSPIVLGRVEIALGAANEPALAGVHQGVIDSSETHADSPDLGAMNDNYFVAEDGAGRPAIWREGTDPETGAPRLVAQTQAEFALAHANRYVTILNAGGGTKRVRLATWWLTHPARRQYRGMALIPGGPCPDDIYNLWRGFGAASAPGDVSPMLDHIGMLCSRSTELIEYVVGWLAFCVQHPGERPEVALVFQGDEGTGKGTLFRLMLKLFGAHGLHITQTSHLVGHFNAHLRWALFVFVDEGYWAGDKAAEGVLKGLVTEPTIAIEVKGPRRVSGAQPDRAVHGHQPRLRSAVRRQRASLGCRAGARHKDQGLQVL